MREGKESFFLPLCQPGVPLLLSSRPPEIQSWIGPSFVPPPPREGVWYRQCPGCSGPGPGHTRGPQCPGKPRAESGSPGPGAIGSNRGRETIVQTYTLAYKERKACKSVHVLVDMDSLHIQCNLFLYIIYEAYNPKRKSQL